eukprot:GGOE01049398.1.p2 GENE.GGOE01049398.1~~GGOE01049398.1.p2  ORF type:complete len:129 (+),score=35.56 GGOE01049398.1:28-414(+)
MQRKSAVGVPSKPTVEPNASVSVGVGHRAPDSLLEAVLFNGLPPEAVRRRVNKVPRKMLMLSSFLFLGGCVLLTIATICTLHTQCEQTLGLWILGGIMMLPGGYSMFILVNYVRKVRGYHWKLLPESD